MLGYFHALLCIITRDSILILKCNFNAYMYLQAVTQTHFIIVSLLRKNK